MLFRRPWHTTTSSGSFSSLPVKCWTQVGAASRLWASCRCRTDGSCALPPSSFLPHKEFRFILPTLPPIACLIGQLQLLMQHTLTHPSPLSSFLPSCLLIALTHPHPSLPSSPFTVCNVCQSIGVYLMCLVRVILLH